MSEGTPLATNSAIAHAMGRLKRSIMNEISASAQVSKPPPPPSHYVTGHGADLPTRIKRPPEQPPVQEHPVQQTDDHDVCSYYQLTSDHFASEEEISAQEKASPSSLSHQFSAPAIPSQPVIPSAANPRILDLSPAWIVKRSA